MNIETLRWTARELLPKRQSAWLVDGMEMLRLDFAQIGEEFPNTDIIVDYPQHNVSYSWLGMYIQQFSFSLERGDLSKQTQSYILINPTSTSLRALDTLVHELVHAVVGAGEGHGDEFQRVAAAIGLDDRGTASSAEEALMQRLIEIRNILGPYPLVFNCLEEA